MYYPFLLCALAGLSTSLGAVFVILGGGINDDKKLKMYRAGNKYFFKTFKVCVVAVKL